MNFARFKPRFQKPSGSDQAEREVLDLVWSAIDGDANEADLSRLQQLVASQQPAREACQNAIEMHSSLQALFS